MDSHIDEVTAPAASAGPGPGSGAPWRVFWLLALIEFMAVMDASAVNIALPSIREGLGFTPTSLAWVVDAYLIGFVGFMLLAGRAADVVGRRRLYVAGVAVFTIFSLACALSQEPWQLGGSRFFQGIGAALVTPAALALITDIFPEGPDRNKALGIFTGMAGVAAPVGLVLGGLLTTASWQWIFLINLPIGLLVLAFSLRLLPRTSPTAAGGLDLIGSVTATGGLILLIAATVRGHDQGWTSALTISEYAAAAVLLGIFVLRQLTAANPLIPTALLKIRNVAVGNVAFALVGAILIAMFFIITLYLQQVRGLSSLEAALIYLPVPLAMLAGTQVAPRLMRFGPPNVLLIGLLVQAVALIGWALGISVDGPVVLAFDIPAAVWSFGLGMCIVSSFVVCTMGLTGQIAGAAAGLATTTYQAGGAIGVAVLAVVADALTHRQLASGVDDMQALVDGYAAAIWSAVGLALAAALLTRFIFGRPQPSAA
ncbi:MFS transporter [Hamadaea sp. NPDC051192]|uniref:MFS transporter n=1 Tax=Hamadaea sp. NPDC051192 TaxID=3154940 RepID=UPI0034495424